MNKATEAANATTDQPAEYFDREGAESYSCLSETFLRRQVAAGNLTVIRIGGRVLFRRDDQDEFLDRHRTTGPATTGRGVMPATQRLEASDG